MKARPLMPLYPTPTPVSKGVIVTGTVHGNTVITATAHERAAGDTETYADDIEALLAGRASSSPTSTAGASCARSPAGAP